MASYRTAGLDIGTSAVRAVELSTDKGEVGIARFGAVALPPGAVTDGDVNDPAVVTAAVKQLWKDYGFKTKRVALSVANRRVVVRQVELPWVPAEELRQALYFQAQDLLPIALEDAVLAHHPLEEYAGDGGARMMRLLLVAADARMVRRAVSAVQDAGLKPAVVDLTPFALLRAVATLGKTVRELGELADDVVTEAIVDVGCAVTNILVHTAGRPRFVRVLMLGGDDVTEAVAEALGVPHDEAEALKRSRAMRAPDAGVADVAAEDAAGRAVEFAAATLVDEVRGSLDYYRAQPDSAPLSRIVLSGGGSQLRNLADRLASSTRLPVTRLGALSGLALPQPRAAAEDAPAEDLDLPVVPIGLAMRAAS